MKGLGLIVLAIWLILMGATMALTITLPAHNMVMGIIAIIAGVLLLIDRMGGSKS